MKHRANENAVLARPSPECSPEIKRPQAGRSYLGWGRAGTEGWTKPRAPETHAEPSLER